MTIRTIGRSKHRASLFALLVSYIPTAVSCAALSTDDASIQTADDALVEGSSALTPENVTAEQFRAKGLSRAGTTIETHIQWETGGGTIMPGGTFTVSDDVGIYEVVATHPGRFWLSDTAVVRVAPERSLVPNEYLPPLVDKQRPNGHSDKANGPTADLNFEYESSQKGATAGGTSEKTRKIGIKITLWLLGGLASLILYSRCVSTRGPPPALNWRPRMVG